MNIRYQTVNVLLMITLILTVGCAPKGIVSDAKSSVAQTVEINSVCKRYNKNFSGSLFVNTGKMQVKCNFGFADAENKVPNTPDSSYLIASTGKQMTASAILRLTEDYDLFSVETKISDLFSEEEYPREFLMMNGTPMRVRHLLNHTSGIPSYLGDAEIQSLMGKKEFGFDKILEATRNEAHILKEKTSQYLRHEPGKGWIYSNTGYIFLGEIIRKVSGASFSEYVGKIFAMAGMKQTTVGRPSRPFVKLYDKKNGVVVDYVKANGIEAFHDGEVFSDGNIYSSLRQLDVWARALFAGKVLSEDSFKKMLNPGINRYGFGLFVKHDSLGNRFIDHGGYYGYTTAYRYYPDLTTSVLFYSNHPVDPQLQLKFLKEIREVVIGKATDSGEY